MKKSDDDLRPEYKRVVLGKGVRGKYAARYSKGTNLVLLEDEMAEVFPTSEAVNEALSGLVRRARKKTVTS